MLHSSQGYFVPGMGKVQFESQTAERALESSARLCLYPRRGQNLSTIPADITERAILGGVGMPKLVYRP